MLKQRTHVSWRHGRDRPLITTTYEDRGPARTRRTRSGPVRNIGIEEAAPIAGEDVLIRAAPSDRTHRRASASITLP